MPEEKMFATRGQLVAVGFKIAGTTVRLLCEGGLSFKAADQLVLDEGLIEKIAEEICRKTLNMQVDGWVQEKRRIEIFYKKFFKRTIDWSKISVPQKREEMGRLEFVFSDITLEEILDAYKKVFGKDSVKILCEIIDIIEQEERPDNDYAFMHVGKIGPDIVDNFLSASRSRIKLMILKEGIISLFRHRTETKKMYDMKTRTYFNTLLVGNFVVCSFCNEAGELVIDKVEQDKQTPTSGFRRVGY